MACFIVKKEDIYMDIIVITCFITIEVILYLIVYMSLEFVTK